MRVTSGRHGQALRAAMALSYRHALSQLEGGLGCELPTLHVFGGGIQNRLLNQLTSDAVARPTLNGPVEATAIGNVLVQASGYGAVRDTKATGAIVARSLPRSACKRKMH